MSWVLNYSLAFHNWRNGVGAVKAALQKTPAPLRLGVLSAAEIAPGAIFDPVATHPDVIIAGVAARNKAKAEAQIEQYGLKDAKAYEGYDEILKDPSIDAVYIPLPNALHAEWAIKAAKAGKHALVEKPLAVNAQQAREIKRASIDSGRVILEAFHWRFHPATHVVKSLIDSGEYGAVKNVTAKMVLPSGMVGKDDIRFQYALGGGACMDLIYVFSATSHFAAHTLEEMEVQVAEASARRTAKDAKVDEAMTATYTLTPTTSNGPPVTCTIETDLCVPRLLGIVPRFWDLISNLHVETELAQIHYVGFSGPWAQHAIVITNKATGKKTTQKAFIDGPQWQKRGESWWTTYRYQLEAFVEHVRAVQNGRPVMDHSKTPGPWVSLDDSEAVLNIVDQVYEKAGLPQRR